jgi:hypothetical protein
MGNPYTVVCTLIRTRCGVRIPVGARNFPLLQNAQTGSGARPESYSVGNGVFPEVKLPRRDVYCLSPSNAEVQNERSYTSAPLICLHGVDQGHHLYLYHGSIPRPPKHTSLDLMLEPHKSD